MPIAAFTIPGTSFQVPPEIIVLGLIAGMTYALLAVGLTLVYKSSRVINFAHGEMGAISSTLFLYLVLNHGVGYWPSILAAIVVSLAAGAFIDVVVIRKLSRAPRLMVMVATIAISQLYFVLGLFIPKPPGSAVYPTPFTAQVDIGQLRLGSGHLMILFIAPLIAVVLGLFLKGTRLGLASRASAENLEAAQLAGIPARRISFAIWTVAGLLAGLSAILLGPTRPIIGEAQVAFGPSLMLRALAAAMIGGLTNLPLVFFGGIAIGLIEQLVTFNYPAGGMLEIVLFAIVIAALLVQRRLGQQTRGSEEASWSLAATAPEMSRELKRHPKVRLARWGGLAALLSLAALIPVLLGSAERVLLSSIALFAMMALSLVVLTGFTGQVSLGQFAFVGLGATVGGRLLQLGYPAWMAILYAVVAGGLIALVVGIPALRIRGLFLAVTTLGFTVTASSWLFQQRWLAQVVGGRTSLEITRPTWLGVDFASELNYYWLCLALLVVTAIIVTRMRRTGVGRRMSAVRDNEPQAASMGVAPGRTKLKAFVVSGMIAGLAGYFYGGLLVNFNDLTIFAPEHSLALVALAILGGITTVTGAILGALWVRGLQYFLAPYVPAIVGPQLGLLASGAGLLIAVLQFPGGIASVAFHVRDKVVEKLTRTSRRDEAAEPAAAAPVARVRLAPAAAPLAPAPGSGNGDVSSPQTPAIEAEGVDVRFGGLTAVAGVSLVAHPGEIVGLIGPNGAGKTTLFDVLSGHIRPRAGRVLLEGHDVTGLRPEHRALLGLGRSFQQARLFDEMTVLDSFKVALEREEGSEVVPSVFALPPSLRAEAWKERRARDLLELLGLGPYAGRKVSELSTGMRRFAELGCMVALGARVLLLDEPTAGIAQREVEQFAPVLREVRDHLDCTMVIVEHDIPMIMGLADRVYVLAAGSVIAEGLPEDVRRDPEVIAAYLGGDERLVARSGMLGAGAVPAGTKGGSR